MIQDLLHLLSLCVHIGTIHLIRAEFPDLITAIPVQSAVGYEQIIITALFIILDIRPLDGIVSAAAEPLSVIFIDIVRLIRLRMDRISGLLIQFQQENPAGPGTVDHPHFSIRIIKHRGVDAVWPVNIVKSPVFYIVCDLYILTHDVIKIRLFCRL